MLVKLALLNKWHLVPTSVFTRPISSTPNLNFFKTSKIANSVKPNKISDGDGYQKNMYAAQEAEANVKPTGWDEAKPFSEMPGPKPLPLLGNIWRFVIGEFAGKDLFQLHKMMNERYGNIASLRKGFHGDDFVMIFNAKDTEHVFRNEGMWPIRDGLPIMTHYRKDVRKDLFKDITGLITEQGENWYKFRTVVNPILMQPRVTTQYIGTMDVVAQEFVEIIKRLSEKQPNNEMPEDFDNELNKWALESICLIAIDKRLGCLEPTPNPEAQKLIKAVISFLDLTFQLDLTGSPWRYIATPAYKKFIEVENYISETCMKYIDEALQKIQTSPEKPVHEQSALERILKINKQYAFVMAMDMIIAGIDTTSKTTGGVLYYLAKNPKAQNSLREELKRLLPDKNTTITKEILEDAVYLRAVIKESTRLAPISIGNLRKSQKDLVVGGYQVPKGTVIVSSNLIMSRRDFERGEEFIPERWLRSTTGELSHKNVNPFTSLPFGFGPRSCVGKRLANLEIEILVAKVIRNFVLEWHHPDMRFKQVFLYGFSDPLRLTMKKI